MVRAGHPQNQSIAAALRQAHQTAARQHFDMGGVMASPSPSFAARQNMRDIESPTAGGVIASEIPGRTDKIPMSPAADSYVIPADVVSGLGQGNTLAGARFLDEVLHSGPYGTQTPRISSANTISRPPAPYREGQQAGYADGGALPARPAVRAPLKIAPTGDRPGGVPIITAGGEYVVPPDVIKNHPLLGRGNMKRGHGILDAWVKHARATHIKTLKSLPGPKT